MTNLHAGMLWYWGGQKEMAKEGDILAAIIHYKQKYPSSVPNAVYLHPSQIGEIYSVGGLPVRPDKNIIKGNLLVAVA